MGRFGLRLRMPLVVAAVVGAITLTACDPPPPPVPAHRDGIGCEWITIEEFNQIRPGATITQVSALTGKNWSVDSQYTIGETLYQQYEWSIQWTDPFCYQTVSLSFEDGLYTGDGYWGDVVK